VEKKQRNRVFGQLKVLFKSVTIKSGVIHLDGFTYGISEDICRHSEDTMTIPDASGLIIKMLKEHLDFLLGDVSSIQDYSVSDALAEELAEKVIAWVEGLPYEYQILVRIPVAVTASSEPYSSNGWTLLRKHFEMPGYGFWQENSEADPRNFDFCVSFSFKGAIEKHTNQIALDEITTKVCLVVFFLREKSEPEYNLRPTIDYSDRGWLFAEDQNGKIQELHQLSDFDEVFRGELCYLTDSSNFHECIDLLGTLESIPVKERTKIVNAIHWYVASTIDRSFTSSVVKLSIAVDALLGDSDHERGLKNSIADRLSYLLGENMTERSEITSEVKDFYSLRSKVIHGDVTVLKIKERNLCGEVRVLLQRALMKEIQAYR